MAYSEYVEALHFLKTLSSDFLSSRHDGKKLNTDSESALKSTLKNGLKCISKFCFGSAKMALEHF